MFSAMHGFSEEKDAHSKASEIRSPFRSQGLENQFFHTFPPSRGEGWVGVILSKFNVNSIFKDFK
jgi:hypothetical protein